MMRTAISNSMLSMNFNPELVREYMRLAGETELVRNHNRKAAAWVTKAGFDCAINVGIEYNSTPKIFSDTVGIPANYRLVDYSAKASELVFLYESMAEALTKLTGKPAYK